MWFSTYLFLCLWLCRVVNETWKNDNRYNNQIFTWKMTSSLKLWIQYTQPHHILCCSSFFFIAFWRRDGSPFHPICNYQAKANCFSIIISSFLRATHNQLFTIFLELLRRSWTTEFRWAILKLFIGSWWKFFPHPWPEFPIRAHFFLSIAAIAIVMIERLNVTFWDLSV